MNTKSTQVFLIVLILAVFCMALSTGCKPTECRQMVRCCEELEKLDVEGLGAACGPMAKELSEETTCRSVLQTVGYMLEDKQLAVPDVCR